MSILALAAAVGLIAAGPADQRQYAEGQVWEYRTRPGEEASRLKIQKIESFTTARGAQTIYHISVVGLKFPDLPLSGELQHAPVSRQTLDASVTRLSSSAAAFPDPSAGIEQWRAAKGGVFTIPVMEIVSLIEQNYRAQAGG